MDALTLAGIGCCTGIAVILIGLLTLGLCKAAKFGDLYDGVPKDE